MFPAAGPMLAFDLVANLRSREEIRARYRLAEEELQRLEATPWFAAMVEEARARWASDMSAIDRVRAKALVALEEVLDVPFSIARDEEKTAAARLDAVKALERLAGVQPPGQGGSGEGGGGTRFSVTIDLGGGNRVDVSIGAGESKGDRVIDGEAEAESEPEPGWVLPGAAR